MTDSEKQLQDLLVVVTKMEKTQESTIQSQKTTTRNVDKIADSMVLLIPVHAHIANIRKILYASMVVVISFGVWITLSYFSLREMMITHAAVQIEHDMGKDAEFKIIMKDILKEINKNGKQYKYILGRMKRNDK